MDEIAEGALVAMRPDETETYLDVLDDALELRGPLCPGVDQVHGPVKVLHVFTVHLHERSQFLQDVSDPRVGVPAADAENKRLTATHLIMKIQVFFQLDFFKNSNYCI